MTLTETRESLDLVDDTQGNTEPTELRPHEIPRGGANCPQLGHPRGGWAGLQGPEQAGGSGKPGSATLNTTIRRHP